MSWLIENEQPMISTALFCLEISSRKKKSVFDVSETSLRVNKLPEPSREKTYRKSKYIIKFIKYGIIDVK